MTYHSLYGRIFLNVFYFYAHHLMYSMLLHQTLANFAIIVSYIWPRWDFEWKVSWI